jgi:flagellar motor switch protein FliN/FliY
VWWKKKWKKKVRGFDVALKRNADMEINEAAHLMAASELRMATGTESPAGSVAGPAWSAWSPAVETASHCTSILNTVLREFWGVPVEATFLSVSDKPHYYWRMDDFHVAQLSLPAPQVQETPQSADYPSGSEEEQSDTPDASPMALLRLSDTACSVLLDRVLGCPEGRAFDFTRLSALEASILNEFSRDVLSCLKKTLIQKPGRHLSGETVHLIWVVHVVAPTEGAPKQVASNDAEPACLGKIILSLPVEAVRIRPMPPPAQHSVSDAFFYHVETQARLELGHTRMTLSDINQLELEDLVVLEQSQANRMFLVEPASEERLPFQVEIQQKAQISIPSTQELDMMETQSQGNATRQTLWDNLMIDVSAGFAPVKLPLKQLKQMSEGLVVEMGDLIHNKVCLQVEGKTLAWGELLVVGDKFGVRISHIASESDAEAALPVQSEVTQEASHALLSEGSPHSASDVPVSEEVQTGADEEQNLDNFLNEDFDDAFDDEEDW